MKNIIVAPSILSADFKRLEQEIKIIESAGAEWLHFDVMDGHFVPNISFGVPVLKSIAGCHSLVNDVHIMISDPKKYAETFVKSGAQYLTFHYEACENDIKVQFKGEIDLSEVKDYSLGKVDVDASLECSANMNVNINFEKNKSYLDKLPNEEELATYHEINGELIREKIKELFSKVDELER